MQVYFTYNKAALTVQGKTERTTFQTFALQVYMYVMIHWNVRIFSTIPFQNVAHRPFVMCCIQFCKSVPLVYWNIININSIITVKDTFLDSVKKGKKSLFWSTACIRIWGVIQCFLQFLLTEMTLCVMLMSSKNIITCKSVNHPHNLLPTLFWL